MAAPPLDLRQGAFARQTQWQFDRKALRRVGLLATALGALTLAVPGVETLRLNREAARLEQEALAAEQNALGGESAEAKLATLRGPGAGFAATMRAVRAAIQATPNAELVTASFEADGTLSINIRASAVAELDGLRARLAASGFAVVPSSPNGTSQQLGIKGQ
jgi:general secretion pathway protein L